jgi:hypothetical protein
MDLRALGGSRVTTIEGLGRIQGLRSAAHPGPAAARVLPEVVA